MDFSKQTTETGGKIAVIGSLNLDMVVSVTDLPRPGETLSATSLSSGCGGKGGNQACAIARLGGRVSLYGGVGADASGALLEKSLCADGVDTAHLLRVEGVPSGTAIITVDRVGTNSICVVRGANQMVTPAYLDAHWASIAEAQILLMQLEIPIDTVCHAAKRAKAEGKMVILDPAPAVATLPGELLELTDLIKPNETELGVLTNCVVTRENILSCCQALHRRGTPAILVSLGDRGAILSRQASPPLLFPPIPCQAVDTTAAGDAFLGAVAVCLAHKNTLEEAISFATGVAAMTVTRHGAQASIPFLGELKAVPAPPPYVQIDGEFLF